MICSLRDNRIKLLDCSVKQVYLMRRGQRLASSQTACQTSSRVQHLRVSVSKGLFDGLEVEPSPALPGGVLLPRRDSSTLHPQFRLVSSVLQLQTDGGIMLWWRDTNKQSSDVSVPERSNTEGSENRPCTQTHYGIMTGRRTAGPRPEPPPHLYPLVQYLRGGATVTMVM